MSLGDPRAASGRADGGGPAEGDQVRSDLLRPMYAPLLPHRRPLRTHSIHPSSHKSSLSKTRRQRAYRLVLTDWDGVGDHHPTRAKARSPPPPPPLDGSIVRTHKNVFSGHSFSLLRTVLGVLYSAGCVCAL